MNALFDRIWERKTVFFGTFFVVFTLSYIVLLAIDLIPEKPADVSEESESTAQEVDVDKKSEEVSTEETVVVEGLPADSIEDASEVLKDETEDLYVTHGQGILPTSISIQKLGRTVSVLNPDSRSIADLDAALLDGVVRHPDSASLGQDGTVFILGHSSYLPQVFNKNFQAFNGIQNLEWGDLIEVASADTVFEYRVEKVYRARAQDLTVPIAGTGKMLTLATCNSFGTADDRYIVEAKQVGTHRL